MKSEEFERHMSQSKVELNEADRRLFAQLLREEGIGTGQQPGIPRRGAEKAPLSYGQQRMWFLQQIEDEQSNVRNLPFVLHIRGAIQLMALERALNEIVCRHEVLRSSIVDIDGVPEQRILPPRYSPLPLLDLAGYAGHERESVLQRNILECAHRSFDLANGPLLWSEVIRVAPEMHVLIVVVHHIVSDGWSMEVFARELESLYGSFVDGRSPSLPELPIQYSDFAVWQREQLQGEILEKQLAYWKEQLCDLPDLELPMARQRTAARSQKGGHQFFMVPEKTVQALSQLSESEGATLFMTLLAAFQLLLSRYSGQMDVVVGTPIAGRTQEETEHLLGLFVNTLVLRTDLSGNPTFRELLQRIRSVAFDAYANQDAPFEKLVEELQPERDPGRSPLFQVMFILQNAATRWALPQLEVKEELIELGVEEFDIRLELTRNEQGLRGVLGYRTDILDDAFMQRMAGHFQVLLEGIAAEPEQRIARFRLLPPEELQQVVEERNRTRQTYPVGACIHDLFSRQAGETPNATAVEDENVRMSYMDLDRRANQLAHYLCELGVRPEVRVGVCMQRSASMVVALLGILKAGGAYVALDPAYPLDRLQFVVEDSGIEVLITESSLKQRLQGPKARQVQLDLQADEISQKETSLPLTYVAPENAAYVIYTSGSTGRPKGTLIEHRSATTLLYWARQVYTGDELSGVLASTSICFDLSVFELFVPLSWGGRVILVKDALQLATLTNASRVKLINTVPSAITELLRVKGVPSSVVTVNLAGEPLKRKLVDDIYQNTRAFKVFNLYGPTEDTTYSTYSLVGKDDKKEVTIGQPLANTQVFLLDPELQPVPTGIPGELYIGGDGLARGYLDRPDLTSQKFISNPFSQKPGARLYHTGDLARWNEDGNLEFLGRMDHQVKVRGFRIELGEVETALEALPGVEKAVAGVWEQEGDRRLIAHYVGGSTPDELKEELRTRLPEYMVPSGLFKIAEMPLTPNGKIDRKRLPVPESFQVPFESLSQAPETPVQELVANIWADLLKISRVGLYDNFFRLGGHSLLATRVISRLREIFQVEVPVRILLEHPVLADFCSAVTAREAKPGQTEKIAAIFKQVQAMSAR